MPQGDATAHVLSKNVTYTAGEAPAAESTVSEMSGVFTGDEVTIKCDEYEDFAIAGSKLAVNDEGTELVATENGLAGPDYRNKEITVTLKKHKDGEAYELTKTFVCTKGE